MRIVVIAVGKLKERGLRDLVDDYLARIRRHVACDEIELREGKHVEGAMRAAIPEGAHTVALEVGGRAMTSEQLAQHVVTQGSQNKGIVVFLIGGADGLPPAISRSAELRLSLHPRSRNSRALRPPSPRDLHVDASAQLGGQGGHRARLWA